ncbi:MAG: cytochrome P460 family protein [Gammaproteobacteria bacterium]|nr:cytochrome P460 family protein [Gammaproteobacteria bacterium]
MRLSILAGLVGLTLILSNSVLAEGAGVPYPEGYRNWFHVKTMLIQSGHPLENPFQGIHHIYANSNALEGLKTGAYQEDSVLVFDLLKYLEKDQTIQEGDRKLVGIMHKNTKRYSSTGGWGFEGFAGNSRTERLVNDGGVSCFACHSPEQKTDYVFSKIRK